MFSFAQNTVYYWFDGQQSYNTFEGNEVSTEGLATGIHFVHFQIEGNDGVLGPVKSKAFLVINEETRHSSSYSGINYWFDHQSTKKAYSGGQIDCSELAVGLHAAHFQIIDAGNVACPVQTQFFLQLQSEAYKICYWFDDDAERYTKPVSYTELSVEGLTYGHHSIHVQLLDSRGKIIRSNPVSADFVIVCPDDEHVDANSDGMCDVCDELLSYSRSVTVDRYGTICLPKGANNADITGATIYSLAGKRVDDIGNPTSLVLEEVSEMEAGKPYIFLANGSKMNIVYSGEAVTEAGSSNGLVGSFTGCSVAEGMYLLSSNQIVKCGAGCSIGANRAYINMGEVQEYVDGSVSPAKMAVIGLDGTDGVSGVSIEGDAVRHNLSGIRVPSGTKGIIIVNGKKVVSK